MENLETMGSDNLRSKLKFFNSKYDKLSNSKDILIKENEKLTTEINNIYDKIFSKNNEIENNKLVKKISDFYTNFLKEIIDIKNPNVSIESDIKQLDLKKAEILESYKKFSQNIKIKNCFNCSKDLIFNDNSDCYYHEGNLKYFSCRECGADEYYTCCDKCFNCSNGCIKTKHFFN